MHTRIWIIHILHAGTVVFLTLLAIYVSWINSIVSVTSEKSPDIALRFDPADASAKTAFANQMLSKNPNSVEMQKIGVLAKGALIDEILNPEALRLLALSKIASGNLSDANVKNLMLASSKMSRRDLLTNSWFVENLIADGNAAEALTYFDKSFRSNYIAQSAFFPRLSALMRDDVYRRAMIPYIKSNAPWIQGFLYYNFSNAQIPKEMSYLIIESGGLPNGQYFRDLEGILITQLVSTGDFLTAQKFYKSLRKGTQESVLTSPQLTAASINPSRNPISWTLQNSSTTDSRFSRSAERNGLALVGSATAGGRGIIARKLLFLGSGNYQLSANRTTLNGDKDASLSLEIKCVLQSTSDPKILFYFREGLSAGEIFIPSHCLQQELIAEIAAGESQNGAEIMLSEIKLRSRLSK